MCPTVIQRGSTSSSERPEKPPATSKLVPDEDEVSRYQQTIDVRGETMLTVFQCHAGRIQGCLPGSQPSQKTGPAVELQGSCSSVVSLAVEATALISLVC